MTVASRQATCPTCKVRGEWKASAKGFQYMVTLAKNGRFTNRIVHKHDGKMVWRPWGEYRTGSPTGRTDQREVEQTARMAHQIHIGKFIGPLLRLEDCIHNVVHHGGSIRTCLRCGHSLVG